MIYQNIINKDNKLTNKIYKILKEKFDLHSSNGKMSKSQ